MRHDLTNIVVSLHLYALQKVMNASKGGVSCNTQTQIRNMHA